MRRLALTLFALFAAFAAPFAAQAGEAYSAQSFAAAQAAGKTILVHVTASWCPTCHRQHPIVSAIEKEKPELVVLDVDFDTAKDVLKRFGVRYQSTLILFKGSAEIARSTGETNPSAIRAMVAKGA